MMYNELTTCCFFSPKHVGIIDLANPLCAFYQGGNKREDSFELYLLCNKSGMVIKACFKAYGNPYLIAGAEWLCQQLEGHLIGSQQGISATVFIEQFAIPADRHSVALVLEDGYLEIVARMKAKLALKEKQ